jgi:hypothetical protein
MNFPQEKYIWTYVFTYWVLEVQPPLSPDFGPSDFHLWGHLRVKPLANSVPVENEKAYHKISVVPLKPFATTSGPLKGCDNAWSGVLFRVGHILCIRCKLWLDKNSTSTHFKIMYNFNITIMHGSYMFRLSQSNHYQAVYQKCENEIILHVLSGRDFGLTKDSKLPVIEN